jgi:hypothetical protein
VAQSQPTSCDTAIFGIEEKEAGGIQSLQSAMAQRKRCPMSSEVQEVHRAQVERDACLG